MATYEIRSGYTNQSVGVVFIDSQRTLDLAAHFASQTQMRVDDTDLAALGVCNRLPPLVSVTNNPAAPEAKFVMPLIALRPFKPSVTDGVGVNSSGVIEIGAGFGGGGGGGASLVVQDEGVVLAARSALDFAGAGVTVNDDAANNRTVVTISGAAGGGITPVNPATLSPAMYFKADSLALSNGAAVSAWSDSSSNTRNASQATSGYRPVYRTNQVNGLPAVEFDDVDDHLTTASVSTPASGMTVLCVGSRPWNAWRYAATISSGWGFTTGWGLMAGVLGLEDWAYEDMILVGNGFGAGRSPRVITETGMIPDGSYHVFGGRLINATSPVTTGIVDGAPRSTRFANGGNVAATSAPIILGAAGVADNTSWDGFLAEIIVWFSALSDANLQGAVEFLLTKYAIAREPE